MTKLTKAEHPQSIGVPDGKIAVSEDALRSVLQELNGPDHHIRELQYTRNIGKLTGDHPILILIDEFNAEMELRKSQ